MNILAIETSCDETALALVEANGGTTSPTFTVKSTALNSQIDIHKEYGGVFPAMAKRAHAENIVPLLEEVLGEVSIERDPEINSGRQINKADWDTIKTILEREPEVFEKLKNFNETNAKPDIDMIAVTSGPGLEPALWVGINVARALSVLWNIPVLPVNHMEGHIASVLLEQHVSAFPALALLISGGHTELITIASWGAYTKIGQTVDDAVGEAYDKVARMLDLPYPGGPEISALAATFRASNVGKDEAIKLPRPMLHSKDYNFSFSGLKTAVLYLTQDMKKASDELSTLQKQQIAFEFESAVTEVLVKKTVAAIAEHTIQSVIVGGGVIANQHIRTALQTACEQESVPIYFPQTALSTDNAVMIAMAGYLAQHHTSPEINPVIRAEGNLSLEQKQSGKTIEK